MEEIPRELDWVQVRAICTLDKMFEQLHAAIKNDVADINSIRKFPAETGFEVTESSRAYAFTVKRAEAIRPWVTFAIIGDRINVTTDSDGKGRDYRITMSDEGRCKLIENGEEREQWQVRKAALEWLFFPSSTPIP